MAFTKLLVLMTTWQFAEGHYTFARLRQNGDWKKPYQYIRHKVEPFEEAPLDANFWERYYHWPTHYTHQWDSVRCGRGNMQNAADTEILNVQAGDEIEIVIDASDEYSDDHWWPHCPDDRGSCGPNGWIWRFIHDGPVVVHLSAVPEDKDIREYNGSGTWVKIFTLGLEWREDLNRPVHWLAKNGEDVPPRINFTIPEQTPPGDYLMRMDQIWPGTNDQLFDPAQMYPSCAQIRVESNSTVEFPQGIKIPQNLDRYSPGMSYSRNMSQGVQIDNNYVYPGGDLWTGEDMVVDAPLK